MKKSVKPNELLQMDKVTENLEINSNIDDLHLITKPNQSQITRPQTSFTETKNASPIIQKIAIPDSKNINKDQENFGFYIKKGKYYTKERKGKIEVETELSNFTMQSMFHLVNGTNDSQRIIFIQRHTGEKNFVEVRSSEMKPESFETILKSKRCTFLGQAYYLKQVFARMMDEEQEAIILNELGLNSDYNIYVFADSIYNFKSDVLKVDELGIISYNQKKFYLPAYGFSNIGNEDYKTERLYNLRPGKIDFEKWSNLYYTAYGDNACIGILYTIIALNRDIVFSKVGFFPFLFLFGDFGTGKTSFTEKLLALFGEDVIGTPLNNSTVVALSRLVSSRNNGMFYFKEYTNETDASAEDFILTAYDGSGRTTGQKTLDSKTKTYPVKSALIFDGNHMPSQKAAILSRMILLDFEMSRFTEKETLAFNDLKEYSKYGFGSVLIEILKHRKLFSEKFETTFSNSLKTLKDSIGLFDERTIKHAALLLTAVNIYSNILHFPFNTETALEIIRDNASKLNRLLKSSGILTVFWESFSYNIKKGFIQNGVAYRLKSFENSNQPEGQILQIKITDIYPHYARYCKENNLNYVDKNSLTMFLTSKNIDYFIPSNQKGRGKAYNDKVFGSCYQYKIKNFSGGIEIDGVEISIPPPP